MSKNNKTIYKSIRKRIAPPTKVFKNKKEELLKESIEQDYEDLTCDFCGGNCYNQSIYDESTFCYMCMDHIQHMIDVKGGE